MYIGQFIQHVERKTNEIKSSFQSDVIETLVSLVISEQKTSLTDKKQVTEQVIEQVKKLIQILEYEMSRVEMMELLQLNHRPTFLYSYLKPTLGNKLIEMKVPDNTNNILISHLIFMYYADIALVGLSTMCGTVLSKVNRYKTNSNKQKYRLTSKGSVLKNKLF
jgi:uncharacterized coiled-coil protein SlyX